MTRSPEPTFRFVALAGLRYDESGFILDDPLIGEWRGRAYVVPEGFETDLASIPRVVQWLLPVIDKHVYPSIMHDYGYEDGWPNVTRAQVDRMFLDAMAAIGVPWWKRNLMWAAVRAFGAPFWGRR